jgi:hypothetical protein
MDKNGKQQHCTTLLFDVGGHDIGFKFRKVQISFPKSYVR